MSEVSAFKQIIGYVDELNQDVGQVALLIEREMADQDYVSLPAVGRRACWFVSSAIHRPTRWRLRHVVRYLIRKDTQKVDHTLFYMILLEVKSGFDFPAVICGRLEHPPFTDSEIHSNVISSGLIKSLTYPKSRWTGFRDDKGWGIARPADEKSPIKQVRGYILNLFDIDQRLKVMDNIVRPLTEDWADMDLDSVLTVRKYMFPEQSPIRLSEETA